MQNTETALRERLAHRIGANRYRTWFADGVRFVMQSNGVDVFVQNAFVCNWIVNNFMNDMVSVTHEMTGADGPPEVRVIHETPSADPSPTVATPAPVAAPRPARSTRRRTTLRGELDTFVVGASNRLAFSAASAVVREPGVSFRQLVIHGGCGLGKTHLLHGVCNGLRKQHPTLEWRYVSGEEFTNEYICALRDGRIELFRARFRGVGVLVIDDIHFLANKKATQEEFLHTFDAIDACGKGVILSSDCHPRAIATLSEPLINRLVAGMVVSVGPPDREMRREILRRRAAALELSLSEESIDFIAESITRNVRELEGALVKLKALAALVQAPIDFPTVRRSVEELVDRRSAPSTSDILRRVSAYFGVTREQVLSKSRDRTVSTARAFIVHILRKQTGMSYPEIGRALGAKNHSTALMANQRIERALQSDERMTWKRGADRREAGARDLLNKLISEVDGE